MSDKFLGHLAEEESVTYVADTHGFIDPENVLAPLQTASCTYRIALGPRAGRKVLSLLGVAEDHAPQRAAHAQPIGALQSSRSRPSQMGRNRHLRFFGSGRSNMTRGLPLI
jgi:hypothetical protein